MVSCESPKLVFPVRVRALLPSKESVMAFIGFIAVVIVGIALVVRGLGALFFVKVWGGTIEPALYAYAALQVGFGTALLYYGATHAPFTISMNA
jgi:hypothetical protein